MAKSRVKSPKTLLIVLLFFSSVILGSTILMFPGILIFPLSLKIGQKYARFVMGSFLVFVACLFESIGGIKLNISGDIDKTICKKQPTIIISNHGTMIDMLIYFSLCVRLASIYHVICISASKFKHVPFLGWLIQIVHYIFVQKKWDKDKETVIDSMKYFCSSHFPVQLFIFPEGAMLTESNHIKDKEYSIKNDLPLNKYVLHPKTTGFIQCLQTLRTCWRKKEVDVYDITIGYVGNIQPDTFTGPLPKEVHFHVTHYPSSTLPSSDEELSQWLKKRWREKEELLTEFYKTSSFPGPVLKDSWITKAIMVAILLKWFILCAAVIYGLFQAPVLMSIMLCIPLVIHVVVDQWMDGWDKIALKKWRKT